MPYFLIDRRDYTSGEITVLLTQAGAAYLLGFAGIGSKLNSSSCHSLENVQILREFRDNCTPALNTLAQFTDVQGYMNSSVSQQSSHGTDDSF